MEKQNSTSASLTANVSVKPVLSHTAIVAVLILSAISLLAGLLFLWHGKDYSWIPFSIFFVTFGTACVGWWRSQKLIDLGNSAPTKLSDKDGNELMTDTRIFESANSVAQIGTLFQSMGMRNPLPEPEGLVDIKGEKLPDSKSEAIEAVNNINNDIKGQTQNFVNEITQSSAEVTQDFTELPEESYIDVLDHNQTTPSDSV